MKEQIFIYDRNDVLLNDPERSMDYATGLRWKTLWPKGYGPLSCQVKRDIAVQWAVKMAYRVIVRDGQRTVYNGRLGALDKKMSGIESTISVPAVGWYAVLAERKIRKRWADNAMTARLEWNKNDTEQQSFQFDKRDNFLLVRMADKDLSRDGERYEEKYLMPAGETVKRIACTYSTVGGEEKIVLIYNGNGTLEYSLGGLTNSSGSIDHTLTTPTQTVVLKLGPNDADIYDQNDKITVVDLTAYSETGTIDAQKIIEDVLSYIGDEISADYSLIGNPGLSLVPFITKNDDYETGDAIIQRAAGYGDSSLNTWGFSVWDEFGASDGLPRGEFKYRDQTAYKYMVELADLTEFRDAESDAELYNYIIVKYQDEGDVTRYRTPVENGDLQDATSVARYGRRDYVLDIGSGDTTRADYMGERFLEYHKEPLRQTSFSTVGKIRNNRGVWTPANRVRAGDGIKILDYHGGEVFFLRHTVYDAESEVLQMEPDLPPDDLVIYTAQEEL